MNSGIRILNSSINGLKASMGVLKEIPISCTSGMRLLKIKHRFLPCTCLNYNASRTPSLTVKVRALVGKEWDPVNSNRDGK